MTRPAPKPIDPDKVVELALDVIAADRFPYLATIDGDQPRLRPVSPVRTDGFTVYVAKQIVLLTCITLFGQTLRAEEAQKPGFLKKPGSSGQVDYLRDIKPLLAQKCYACHSALKQKAGLRLDTAALIRQGGDSGPPIEPGKSAESLLIDAVSGANGMRQMPLEGEPLKPEQIALLKQWIDEGAVAPEEPVPEDPRRHGSFQPPQRPAVPELKNAVWVRNPIDAFIAAEHERRGLEPGPPAPKHVLLARVYLDLVGLPPTREELHAFLADSSDDAYEKVVDRLLASPQYGERWGRHWMDVWRYSDWYGVRVVNDVQNSYPHIWRWRDWIVRSLNEDKGYDRMVLEMLAADEVAPEDDETVVATGFIVRSWFRGSRDRWLHDVVEHTGKAFLGLTLNCAQCHDHKYDPISQEEFFQLRAVFEPVELRQDRVAGLADPGPFDKAPGLNQRWAPIEAGLIRVHDRYLDAETFMFRLADPTLRIADQPPVAPGIPALFAGALAIERVNLPLAAYYPGFKSSLRDDDLARRKAMVTAAEATRAEARQALARVVSDETEDAVIQRTQLRVRQAEAQQAFAQAELEGHLHRMAADDARYGIKPGNVEELSQAASRAERHSALCEARQQQARAELALFDARQGDSSASDAIQKAEEQFAAAAKSVAAAEEALHFPSTQYKPLSPTYHDWSTGRRTALARWITSPSNPLAARVAVNHIWMRHFGTPLVSTVFDFGRNGKPPTHPELLDWLACEFMGPSGSPSTPIEAVQTAAGPRGSWNMKRFHRLLVTTNTYRMQSAVAESAKPNAALDPDNRFLWRMNRRPLEAEAIRDRLLYVSGDLDLRHGGPEIDVAQGETVPRRSLYFSHHAEVRMPFLELFDGPNPHECYRRSASIVPQQALALTNSGLTLQQSGRLAERLWNEVQTVRPAVRESAFLVAAFERILSRQPTEDELAACRDFLRRQTALLVGQPATAAVPVGASTARGSERAPAERARVDLVHVLFSHHDFLTIH